MRLRNALISTTFLLSLAGSAAAQEATTPAATPTPEATTPAAAPTPEARITAMKESFIASKAALKGYQWVETTILLLDGQEKVKQQNTCYYGAEGGLQRVPVAASASEDKKRGVRGRVADSKKAELEASLKDAVALLRQYVPPDPAKIDAAKSAGNVSVSVPSADGNVKMTIKNYVKAGDEVVIDMDAAKNTLRGVVISSYVGDAAAKDKSPVTAKVTYGPLPDGTLYPAKESLEISAQKLKVDVQNTGYKKQG